MNTMIVYSKIKVFLNRGDALSVKVKKNMLISFTLKGLSILSGFVLVPLTLDYVGVEQYGIWLTLSSIIGWIAFMDLGMGNGMKNKLAAAFALNDRENAKKYVSTTYVGLSVVFGIFAIVFLIATPFLDFAQLLNTTAVDRKELFWVVQIVFMFFILGFILRLIGVVLLSDNRSAMNNAILPVSNIISLLIIYILTLTTKGSLLKLSITYAGITPIMFLGLTLFFFSKEYKYLTPSLKYVDLNYFKEIFNLGFKFFVLQIAVLVIFTTDNIIITRLLGPQHVTPYNIAFRYFNLINMAFGIILQPTWAAYANAYARQDIKWIRGVMRKMVLIYAGFMALALIMFTFSQIFYRFWIGDKLYVGELLSLFMVTSVMLTCWGNLFVMFINATGKIKLQLYITLAGALINIPLSIYFASNLGMGSAGVILATCISIFPGTFIYPYQYKRIVTARDRGIWSK
jgi:O-antigen/teichoic acid export membrane protein